MKFMPQLRVLATFALVVLLSLPLVLAEEPRPLYVEGYCDQLSYVAGEEIQFHISTSAARYGLEVARVGPQREVVWSREDLAGTEHPVPENASSHGCQWPVAFQLNVPTEWRSGYYAVRLSAADQGGQFVQRNRRRAESEMFFVVRAANPGQDTKILLQLTANTYNAYNNWGGSSLYAFHGRAGLQGHRVSFARPLAGFFSNWERPFVLWAERNGYVLDYAVNSDLEFHPDLLNSYRLILSVGHDEYWSAPMRDHVEAFIGRGGNVAFFSGNSVCWQVRSEEEGRALVCWKQSFNRDPLFQAGQLLHLSTLWSHHLVQRPENQLTGVGFLFGGYHRSHGQLMDASGAYTVHRPEHWIFAETGLKRADSFGAKHTIVGYECDGCEFTLAEGLPVPTGNDGTPTNFSILATAPAQWHPDDCEWYDQWEKGRSGAAVLGVYTRDGTVFTAGSTDWAHGLQGGDPVVEQITRNILDRLGR